MKGPAMTAYATIADAIAYVVEPALGEHAADYDLEAIAVDCFKYDSRLGGYVQTVDEDGFWDSAQAHDVSADKSTAPKTETTPEQAEAAAAANSALVALKSAAHVLVHCQRIYDLAPTGENFEAMTAAYSRMDEREARLVARLLDHAEAQGLFEGFDRERAVRCMAASMRDWAMKAAWARVPDARL